MLPLVRVLETSELQRPCRYPTCRPSVERVAHPGHGDCAEVTQTHEAGESRVSQPGPLRDHDVSSYCGGF